MKVGQLMECDFGDYTYDAKGNRMHNVDGHIAPEMVKNRSAVILNTKLNGEHWSFHIIEPGYAELQERAAYLR